jgi:hypothetical protein
MSPIYDSGDRLRIFVSSKSRLQDDRELARGAIEELGMEPVLVEMEKWVATTNRVEYLEQVRRCDILLVLLELGSPEANQPGEDAAYRFVAQEIELAQRLGKAVLMFVRTAGGAGEPSRILQAMYDQVFGHKYGSAAELAPAIKASLRAEVFRRYRARSRPVADRAAFYRQAAEQVRGARRRIYLGAETPVVIFGPRKRLGFENDFYVAMMDWIESLTEPANAERRCVVFFNPESVRQEMRLVAVNYDQALVRRNLERLDEVLRRGGNLQLLPTPGPHSCSLFDNTYIVWIRSGSRWTGILDDSLEVCDGLERLVHQMSEDFLLNQAAAVDGMDLSRPSAIAALLGAR